MCVVARGRRTNKEKFQFNFSFSCWLTVQKWRSIHSLTLCWLSCREWWKMRIIFLMFLRDDDDDGWRLKVEHNDNVDSRQWWWTFYYISSSWRKTKKRITKAHHFSSFSTATYIRPRVVSLCSSPASAHTKCIRKKISHFSTSTRSLQESEVSFRFFIDELIHFSIQLHLGCKKNLKNRRATRHGGKFASSSEIHHQRAREKWSRKCVNKLLRNFSVDCGPLTCVVKLAR